MTRRAHLLTLIENHPLIASSNLTEVGTAYRVVCRPGAAISFFLTYTPAASDGQLLVCPEFSNSNYTQTPATLDDASFAPIPVITAVSGGGQATLAALAYAFPVSAVGVPKAWVLPDISSSPGWVFRLRVADISATPGSVTIEYRPVVQ